MNRLIVRWTVGTLWGASVVAAFWWSYAAGRSTGGELPEMLMASPDALSEAAVDVAARPLPDLAWTSESRPSSATYGYERLVFTEALGEELLRLEDQGEFSSIPTYMGLDELTEALDAEGVLAAMRFLGERGRLEDNGPAASHLCFRLGMLLGEEGVQLGRSLGAENFNLLLGWTWSEPEAALSWARSAVDSEADRGLVGGIHGDLWKWALQRNPERVVAFFFSEETGGTSRRDHAAAREVLRAVERHGLYAALDPFDSRWLEERPVSESGLQAAVLRYRAAVDPEDTVRALLRTDSGAAISWNGQRQAVVELGEEMPEVFFKVLTDSPDMLERAPREWLTSHVLPEFSSEQLGTLIDAGVLGPMESGARVLLLRKLQSQLPPRDVWPLLREQPVPTPMRQHFQTEVAREMLTLDPQQARIDLHTAHDLHPEFAEMVRRDRPVWELQLWLNQFQRGLMRQGVGGLEW